MEAVDAVMGSRTFTAALIAFRITGAWRHTELAVIIIGIDFVI